MSYTIDYRQKAYFVESDGGFHDKDYLVLHEIGDNNCYECNSRKRVRDWEIMDFNWLYSIWQKIAQWVGCTAGHCLEIKGLKHNYPNGTDLEKYMDLTQQGLKKYANLIKRAKPIKEIFNDFYDISIYINLEKGKNKFMKLSDIKDEYYREDLSNYLKKHKLKLEENIGFYGYKQSTARMQIEKVEDLLEAIKMKRYNNGVQFSILFRD